MFLRKIPVGAIEANCYLYGEGIIIDPGADGDFILDSIKKNNFKPKKIVLTHSHYDHIGAVIFLRDRFNIEILAHSSSKKYLEDPDLNLSSFFGDSVSFTPDRFLEDSDLIESGETKLYVLHNAGALCLFYLFIGQRWCLILRRHPV
jgi:glyoxylase-like metal-dependent hydrolase (beta-lactamase superfamily II)